MNNIQSKFLLVAMILIIISLVGWGVYAYINNNQISKLSDNKSEQIVNTPNNISCNENDKYFVVSKDIPDSVGTYILVKYKKDYSQPIQCTYIRGSANDIEFKSGTAQYFLALTDNFLILDSGTGPEPRGLTVFDLTKKQGVYNDSYAKPISTNGDTMTYWNPTKEKVTVQNCPQGSEWLKNGLPPIIESHVTLNLIDLTKKDLGERRCVPTQG